MRRISQEMETPTKTIGIVGNQTTESNHHLQQYSFKPGQSGNPGGRPIEEKEVRRLARTYGREAIEGLVKIAREAKQARVRLLAWQAVLDRGFGRAPVSVQVDHSIARAALPHVTLVGLHQPIPLPPKPVECQVIEPEQPALPPPAPDSIDVQPAPAPARRGRPPKRGGRSKLRPQCLDPRRWYAPSPEQAQAKAAASPAPAPPPAIPNT